MKSVERFGYPHHTVYRADLHRILAEAVMRLDSHAVVLGEKCVDVRAITGSAGANVGVVLPAVFFAGFCIVGGQAGANAFVGGFYPTRMRATGVGWALGIGRVGSVVGPVAAGWFLAWGWRPEAVFHSAVVPAALAGIAMAAVGRSRRMRENEAAPANAGAG